MADVLYGPPLYLPAIAAAAMDDRTTGAACRKCREGVMSAPGYCPGKHPMFQCHLGAGEHLHRKCSVCGYVATQPCRDAAS